MLNKTGSKLDGTQLIDIVSSAIICTLKDNRKLLIDPQSLYLEKDSYYSLNEILKLINLKYPNPAIVTIIYEEPLCGAIYRYGNHGKYWEKTGKTIGYA